MPQLPAAPVAGSSLLAPTAVPAGPIAPGQAGYRRRDLDAE
ncbi:hypothetical protein [Streptomyces badius]